MTINEFRQVVSKPQVGDLVYLSREVGTAWIVEHTNASNNTMYVKSQVGGRHAQVTPSHVVAIWRREDALPVNNRASYGTE